MSRIARRPSHAVDVYTGGDDIAALEAALNARKIARDKGLPDPVGGTQVMGDRVLVKLLWPAHMLLWIELLDGLGQASVPVDYVDGDDLRDPEHDHYERGQLRRQIVDDDYAVHGWTETDGPDGRVRYQQWVLQPVNDANHTQCGDLPEPRRQPLSVEGWFRDCWFAATGRSWDQPNPWATATAHRDTVDAWFREAQASQDQILAGAR